MSETDPVRDLFIIGGGVNGAGIARGAVGRALCDDGATSATAATRDYVLSLDDDRPPLLNIFGGKITICRRLVEAALEKRGQTGARTAGSPLPCGDFAQAGAAALADGLVRDYPFLDAAWAGRLTRLYGTEARKLLGAAKTRADLGRDFGATLTEAELTWLNAHEFARTADDVPWRRTRLGPRLAPAEAVAV